ncbi:hypothetical protein RND81_02G037500 [Saponaria officinalis]|uniref:F-box domain-containing protein n=1 Tax=Saponaria officinalis TaxID=3572 RepID=A0AAW1MR13_SAPOF
MADNGEQKYDVKDQINEKISRTTRNWGSHPTELWTDILLKLSIKDVLKFRPISQFFRSIIDDSNFVARHFRRHVDHPEALPEGGGHDDIGDGVDYQHCNNNPHYSDHHHVTRTIDNINGLLLLHKFKSRLKNWNSKTELILWNPLTAKTCLIPKSRLCARGLDNFVVNQPVKVGFGYDVAHDDYKIVAIVESNGLVIALL